MVADNFRRIVIGLFAGAAIAFAVATPSLAAEPPNAAVNSTDSILKWINSYRSRPDPESLPAVVRALSAMQAFKDAETCGAYIGFVAGVLSANPSRAESLITKMISIDPADHWVLVRAVAYSGLPHWRELLSTSPTACRCAALWSTNMWPGSCRRLSRSTMRRRCRA